MTSIFGSDLIQEYQSDDQFEEIIAKVMEVVGTHFRPEFINRIDETVVFHPLMRSQIKGIATVQLSHLNERLSEMGMSLVLSDEASDQLVEVGYDPVYGARPLKRAIQKWIENPLANELLAGNFVTGDKIVANVSDGVICFSKES
jgi:ATP-dependent Clp protease ATP-binding subunit ClpB